MSQVSHYYLLLLLLPLGVVVVSFECRHLNNNNNQKLFKLFIDVSDEFKVEIYVSVWADVMLLCLAVISLSMSSALLMIHPNMFCMMKSCVVGK